MTHILMVTVDHSPLDDRIFYKEACTLCSAGYRVSILCRGNHQGEVMDMGGKTVLNPDGKLQWTEQGISIHVVPSSPGEWERWAFRFLRGSFIQRFIQQGIDLKPDVIHAHEPVSFYLGLRMTQRYAAKLIFDSHESWVTGTRKEQWIRNRYLKHLRYLISANHLTRGNLVSDHSDLEAMVVYNTAEKRLFGPISKGMQKDRFTIVHDGYLPFNRGLKDMVEALRLLTPRYPHVRLKLVGETRGAERDYLESAIQEYNLKDHIYETGWVPYEQVPKELEGAAVGIVTKRPTLNNVIGGPPIKYFNYLAAGLAVIDVHMPETTRLLNQFGNGISVRERTPEKLAEALAVLLDKPDLLEKYRSQSRKAFETFYWENTSKSLLDFYANEVCHTDALILR